jgi:hypothetical protein
METQSLKNGEKWCKFLFLIFGGVVVNGCKKKVKSIRPSDGNIAPGLFFRPTDK